MDTEKIQNGLGEAVGCPTTIPGIGGGLSPQNFAGLNGARGGIGTDPTSSGVTLEKNLRNYLISNFRQVLSQAYAEIGLIQTIVDVPVDDALRGGIDIKTLQLEESQIEELRTAFCERDGDLDEAAIGAKWARLFGGGAVLIMSDQDPEEPLDVSALTENDGVEFRAVDLWELSTDGREDLQDGDGIKLRDAHAEFYTYYGVKLHHSRVLRIKGKTAPSFIRPKLRGWGLSAVETLVRSINQYLKATDLTFEVLDEFKLDIYRIKNLMNTLLAPDGTNAVMKRIGIANWQKNYQNAVVLDSEDEYENKQLSFAGLAEASSGIRMQVASDMRMPLTKLFGISSAGFNSGEDDIEVYNSMVESSVRGKMKRDLLRMLEIRCQIMFGFVPDDLSISYKPLRVLSSTDEETVKTQKYTRLLQAKQAGEITTKEFRDACNKDSLLGITLDTDDLAIEDLEETPAPLGDVDATPPVPGADEEKAPRAPLRMKLANLLGFDAPITTGTAKRKKKVHSKYYKDGVHQLPAPYTRMDRIQRAVNSAEFDKASYAADGGDNWIDARRAAFFDKPEGVDTVLWAKGEQASVDAFGAVKWQFVAWWYHKHGGAYA